MGLDPLNNTLGKGLDSQGIVTGYFRRPVNKNCRKFTLSILNNHGIHKPFGFRKKGCLMCVSFLSILSKTWYYNLVFVVSFLKHGAFCSASQISSLEGSSLVS